MSAASFSIPFDVARNGASPSQLDLEVSTDGGASWILAQRAKPEAGSFQFQARTDGLYLFRLKTYDGSGNPLPSSDPPMQVVIDTEKPQAELKTDVNGHGQMVADFVIQETNLNPDSIQIHYRTDQQDTWQPVSPQLMQGNQAFQVIGQATWDIKPGVHFMEVKLVARDQANNELTVFKTPEIPRTAQLGNPMMLASNRLGNSNDPSQSPRIPSIATQDIPPVTTRSSNPGAPATASSRTFPGAVTQSPTTIQRAPSAAPVMVGSPIAQGPIAQGSIGDARSAPKTDVQAKTSVVENPFSSGIPSRANISGNSELQFEVRPSEGGSFFQQSRPVANGPSRSAPENRSGIEIKGQGISALGNASPKPLPTPGQFEFREMTPEVVSTPLPTTQTEVAAPVASSFGPGITPFHSNSKAFSLDYELDADPTAAVSSVDLYGTMDEGKTWKKWGVDPDGQSPFDIKVEDEGLFGFRMVVVSANGFVTNRPVAGDTADAWILVDTQTPQVRLVSARYGQGNEAGSLIVEYQAGDTYLSERGISLSFSETPQGPWTTIATGLKNTGRYAWSADPNLPRRIYLRIEAIDSAGNIGSHRMDLPVDVEGIAPRGRIQGFRPIANPQ